jgi:hypothetical protein
MDKPFFMQPLKVFEKLDADGDYSFESEMFFVASQQIVDVETQLLLHDVRLPIEVSAAIDRGEASAIGHSCHNFHFIVVHFLLRVHLYDNLTLVTDVFAQVHLSKTTLRNF